MLQTREISDRMLAVRDIAMSFRASWAEFATEGQQWNRGFGFMGIGVTAADIEAAD
jgi:hypothetical protein